MGRRTAFVASLFLLCGVAGSTSAPAPAWNGLFNVAKRAQELREPAYAALRKSCLATPSDPKWLALTPVKRLATTEGYGTDTAAESFSWAVMVLSGRSLAGDADATAMLRYILLNWANAGAFTDTEVAYDAYYSLKRQLLPISVAYQVLLPSLEESEARTLREWIDPLVRRVDKRFDGEVDKNNHRVLADSVLALWGSIVDDQMLIDRGLAEYASVLDDMRPDGTLPLEARRGSRALWYQRQTLSSLTVIAEVARGRGIDLYESATKDGKGFATLVGALMNGLSSPVVVTAYSAENYIPGPESDYLKPDLAFLETRGHGRHYMAWIEPAIAGGQSLSFERLRNLFARQIENDRPLIDEFIGGNATCFWGRP